MPGTVRWTQRLSFRMAVLLGPLLLASIGAFAYVSIRSQEEHILEEAARGATLLSETILRSIDHQMLSANKEGAYTTMEVISRHPRIESVRLINARSEVAWSTEPGEVGRPVDRAQTLCARCHATDVPDAPCSHEASAVFTGRGGPERGVAVTTPIPNEPRCAASGCHLPVEQAPLLGVIALELQLDETGQSLGALQGRVLWLSLLVLLALAVPGAVFFHSTVSRPIRALLGGTRHVAQGDLDHVLPEADRSELGQLEHSFNTMTASLRQARAHVDELMAGLEQQVKERTEALAEIQEELAHAEKMSSLGKLSASIAHEINNPLMGILTSSKVLLRGIEDVGLSERDLKLYRRQLELVQREADRCRNIVRSLLDFARQRTLELSPIDVNAALEEAVSIISNQLRLQGVTLEKTLGAAVKVRADFGQVRQALLNILINACDAMTAGGTLRCRTFTHQKGLKVCVEISDTGPGIPDAYLSKIFDPFFTTKEKGTGLGLSVVYGIMGRHGGSVDVDSRAGEGTTIRLWLPVNGPQESPGAPPSPEAA